MAKAMIFNNELLYKQKKYREQTNHFPLFPATA